MVTRVNTGGIHSIVYDEKDKPRPLSPSERRLVNSINQYVKERRLEKDEVYFNQDRIENLIIRYLLLGMLAFILIKVFLELWVI